ncbi:uncharacterized protein LOC108734707 [Agrilus planipennis]|uniref:Uncharacterized protein LOC108734707 n=1 Tax=Agrilus planipennis TaxID=224129 RepID=A0A1W4WD29_AGRPL|nr:uncharacterized protein LOC108734707 [Agrilus planipennis]
MKARRSSKDETELYSINYEDIIRSLEKKAKELESINAHETEMQLELEISQSLKDIIASPKKDESVVLDIEVIRPPEEEAINKPISFKHKGKSELVHDRQTKKKIIESFIAQSSNPFPVTCKVNAASAPVRPPMNYKYRKRSVNNRAERNQPTKDAIDIPIMQEEIPNIHKQSSEKKRNENKPLDDLNDLSLFQNMDDVIEHVYASLNYKKVRAQYPCHNRSQPMDNEKNPCPCQNCAMVGVLMDSQKRPVYTPSVENMEGCQDHSENASGTKAVGRKQPVSKKEEYNNKLKLLIRKLQLLEARLQQQEENKTEKRKLGVRNESSTNTDRKKRTVNDSKRNIVRNPRANKKTSCKIASSLVERCSHHKHKAINTSKGSVPSGVKPRSNAGSMFKNHNYLLYWGKEVIEPGFDLKCKIKDLFQEEMKNSECMKIQDNNIDGVKRNAFYEEPLKDFSKYVKNYLQPTFTGYAKDDLSARKIDHDGLQKDIPRSSMQDIGLKTPIPGNCMRFQWKPDDAIAATTTTTTECVRKEVNVAYINPNFNFWQNLAN